MYNLKEIVDKIFYIGVNDRQKEAFENYLPLPNGVTYNSYVIMDEKVAVVDTVEAAVAGTYFSNLEAVLQGRSVDYLIVHHMEPDHAGSIDLFVQRYPNIQIVTTSKSKEMLKGYFNITENIMEVKEGTTLELGTKSLTFFMAPMVHWPEVMVSYENKNKILFSADAFGSFGTNDGGFMDTELNLDKYWDDMRRYYACIVGKFAVPVQNALKKLSTLEINYICSLHGPVWHANIPKLMDLYQKWSHYEAEEKGLVIAYGTMYGNSQHLAEAIAQGASEAGLKNIVIHNVSKTDTSFILSDIFKYNGLVIGSPTYMTYMYPLIEKLVLAIEHREIANRIYGCFGSFTWASKATKILSDVACKMNWEMIGSVDNKQAVSSEKYQEAYQLGKEMAEAILK